MAASFWKTWMAAKKALVWAVRHESRTKSQNTGTLTEPNVALTVST